MTEQLQRVERPGRTHGPGSELPAELGRIFPCAQCGADLEYAIGEHALRCSFCDFTKPIDLDPDASVVEQDYAAAVRTAAKRRSERDEGPAPEPGELAEIECLSCGARVTYQGTLTSTECAYCGSPQQRREVHTSEDRIAVDGVLAFEIDRDQAQESLGRWMKGRWFAPGGFAQRARKGKFQGVYLPFWTYDCLTFNRYRGRRGEHYTVVVGSGKNRRTVTRIRWYPASGAFQRFFDDLLTLASREFRSDLIAKLEPWPLERCRPFRHEYLAGLEARTYDLPLEEGFQQARSRIDAAVRSETRQRIGGDVQQILSLDTRIDEITYKHLLLPLWLLSYTYRGKVYQTVINAMTGAVHGERPWSVFKIAALVVVLGLIVATIVLLNQ